MLSLTLIRNLNLSEDELPNLLNEISGKSQEQISSILFDIVESNFDNLNCNLIVLEFLKEWNHEIKDSKHRNVIIQNLKTINFYEIEPHNLKLEILKRTSADYVEFCFAILTQLNIPASFLRIASLEICVTKKSYSKICLSKILICPDYSALEKYLALKLLANINSILEIRRTNRIHEFDWLSFQEDYYETLQFFTRNEDNINVNMKCAYFFREYNRKTGKTYYCGFHNNNKYLICNAEGKDQLQEEDCLAFISIITNNYDFLETLPMEMLDFWTFVKISKHSFYISESIRSRVLKYLSDNTVQMIKKITLLENLKIILSDCDFIRYCEVLKFQSCMMDMNCTELFQKLIA